MKKLLSLFIIGAALSYPAVAGQMTVGDLQQICTGTDNESMSACRFYILGVMEGADLAAGVAKDEPPFCLPEGIPSTAMQFVVKKAIGEDLMFYPKDKELAAAGFIGAALRKQWPCKKSN